MPCDIKEPEISSLHSARGRWPLSPIGNLRSVCVRALWLYHCHLDTVTADAGATSVLKLSTDLSISSQYLLRFGEMRFPIFLK